ncbi:peroxisomal targeting signal 2 receptor, partial [Halocaridina rubra]
GHEYPVRRLKYSPFVSTQIATVSYDFTTRLWDTSSPEPCTDVHQSHSEFVYGLDFSNHIQGLMADCAWDQTVGLYRLGPPSQLTSS